MLFSTARPDVIRAINQRWLLNLWKRHLGSGRVPQWQSIEGEDIASASANLSLFEVVGDNGHIRFQVRFHGETLGKVYGSADCRGKHLDEIIPPAAYAEALISYRKAVEDGSPVYAIHEITDSRGRLVSRERLLLPFARDGHNVDRILASFEFICDDGAFDAEDLMSNLSGPPALRLLAAIEAGPRLDQPASATAS